MATVTVFQDETEVAVHTLQTDWTTLKFLTMLSTSDCTVTAADTAPVVYFEWPNMQAVVEGTTIDRLLEAYDVGRCTKCGGTGYLPHYAHVEAGRCFKCDGGGLNIDIRYECGACKDSGQIYVRHTELDHDMKKEVWLQEYCGCELGESLQSDYENDIEGAQV